MNLYTITTEHPVVEHVGPYVVTRPVERRTVSCVAPDMRAVFRYLEYLRDDPQATIISIVEVTRDVRVLSDRQ